MEQRSREEGKLPVRQVGDPFTGNRAWLDLGGHKEGVAMSAMKELMVVGQGHPFAVP